MSYWIGGLIGGALAGALSYFFVFPADVFNLKLAALTIKDVLRILGGGAITLVGALFGAINIGGIFGE